MVNRNNVLQWIALSAQEFQLPPYAFAPVDIEKFAGFWYEIARTPNPFERGCDYATAEYTIKDGDEIEVINTCYQGNKVTREVKGIAKRTLLPFALSVRFPTIWGEVGILGFLPNYFIAWVSSDYQRSVIISPLGNVWFLSRTKYISQEQYKEMLSYVPFTIVRSKVVPNKI